MRRASSEPAASFNVHDHGRRDGYAPVLVVPSSSVRHLEPTGREVSMGQEEIIVSKTDLNGRITYVNDVFLRISSFTREEVIGQPHSFIRHPDMPRCVFRLLWESIQNGKEIFAYVVNMTKNGDHYWVLANITPTFDAHGAIIGYHSNRRAPDRAALDAIRPLYQQLCAIERSHPRKAEAITASTQELQRHVAGGFSSYEEFVFSL